MNQPFVRHGAGVLAILLLIAGTLLLFQENANQFWAAMAIRVGTLLAVIWLAIPQIEEMRSKGIGKQIPSIVMLIGFAALVIIAARPKQATILIPLVGIALAISGALKWFSRMTK